MLQLLHTMEGFMGTDMITTMWGTQLTTPVTMATSFMALHGANATMTRIVMGLNGVTQYLSAEVGLLLSVLYLNLPSPAFFSLVQYIYTCCKLADGG